MASSGMLKLTCVVLISMVLIASQAEAAFSCGTVLSTLSPCITYIQRGGVMSPACCSGAKSLNNAARTTPDHQAACSCIKSLFPSINGNYGFANSIPGKCNIKLPYKLSPSLDCSKVK